MSKPRPTGAASIAMRRPSRVSSALSAAAAGPASAASTARRHRQPPVRCRVGARLAGSRRSASCASAMGCLRAASPVSSMRVGQRASAPRPQQLEHGRARPAQHLRLCGSLRSAASSVRAPARGGRGDPSPTKSTTIGAADIAHAATRRAISRAAARLAASAARAPTNPPAGAGIDIDQGRRAGLLDMHRTAAVEREASATARHRTPRRGRAANRPHRGCAISACRERRAQFGEDRRVIGDDATAAMSGRRKRQCGGEAGWRKEWRGGSTRCAGEGGTPRRSSRVRRGALSCQASRRTATTSRAPSSAFIVCRYVAQRQEARPLVADIDQRRVEARATTRTTRPRWRLPGGLVSPRST